MSDEGDGALGLQDEEPLLCSDSNVLIRKSDGEILDVGKEREPISARLREMEYVKQEHDRTLGKEWEEMTLKPK